MKLFPFKQSPSPTILSPVSVPTGSLLVVTPCPASKPIWPAPSNGPLQGLPHGLTQAPRPQGLRSHLPLPFISSDPASDSCTRHMFSCLCVLPLLFSVPWSPSANHFYLVNWYILNIVTLVYTSYSALRDTTETHTQYLVLWYAVLGHKYMYSVVSFTS